MIKIKIIRQHLGGSIFAVLGIIFLYLELAPNMDHMGHGEHMSRDSSGHKVTLLGIGEMTWMWFTMALVHFFVSDRGCKACQSAE